MKQRTEFLWFPRRVYVATGGMDMELRWRWLIRVCVNHYPFGFCRWEDK